jgi:hypothetical protein
VRKALVLAAAVAAGTLAAAALAAGPPKGIVPPGIQTHPGLPFHPSGSVVGEGMPLKAYANISPAVHLFGDTIHARLAVVSDTRWVDATRLRVSAGFAPYTTVASPSVLRLRVGRFEQTTWTWTLRCLKEKCVPVFPPSEKFHVFRFPSAHIAYLKPNGKVDFDIDAVWPRVEVLSQVSPGVVTGLALKKKYDWQFSLSPVAAPTFRIRPTLLFWLAIGAAGVALLGALFALGRWYLAIRPRRAGVEAFKGTPLDRALALLSWAHAHGDETLQRKAFERVADELGVVPARDDLSRAAHELAWSPRLPEDEEVQAFAEQAREAEPEAAE